jgi:hypothetical protein
MPRDSGRQRTDGGLVDRVERWTGGLVDRWTGGPVDRVHGRHPADAARRMNVSCRDGEGSR